MFYMYEDRDVGINHSSFQLLWQKFVFSKGQLTELSKLVFVAIVSTLS